jgi:hypothetical protein
MKSDNGFLIGTDAQCFAYDSAVTAGENYNGTTTRWAEPYKHPVEDKWAIVKHMNYEEATMEYVAELDSTWFPDDIQDAEIVE